MEKDLIYSHRIHFLVKEYFKINRSIETKKVCNFDLFLVSVSIRKATHFHVEEDQGVTIIICKNPSFLDAFFSRSGQSAI